MARSVVIITGASRGFGRCLALEHARMERNSLRLVLVARSEAGLAETASQAKAAWDGRSDAAATLETVCITADLGDLTTLDATLAIICSAAMRDVEGTRPVTRSVFYNNAGSLGALQALEDLPSLASVRSAIDFNVTAHIWITATWVKLASGMHRRRHEDEAKAASDDAEPTSCNNGSGALPDAGAPERSGPLPSSSSGAGGSAAASAVQGDLSTPPCTVVNVSSGAAVGAMPTFGLYCSGKAARDMLTRCLALECAAKGVIDTFDYAPGPMDTQLQQELITSKTLDPTIRKLCADRAAEGRMVSPVASATKCVAIVQGRLFSPGQHIDFRDVVPGLDA